MSKQNFNLAVASALIVLAVVLRVLPHAANFAPVAAVAIFGGAILPRRLAIAVPLLAMMASDLVIGLHPLIPLTWGCYALFALASSMTLRGGSLKRGIGLTFGSSLFFFAVTNFGVWLTSGMYAHTWNGLSRCYAMALPFFRNTAMSDIVYTAALFGVYYLAVAAGQKLLSADASRA